MLETLNRVIEKKLNNELITLIDKIKELEINDFNLEYKFLNELIFELKILESLISLEILKNKKIKNFEKVNSNLEIKFKIKINYENEIYKFAILFKNVKNNKKGKLIFKIKNLNELLKLILKLERGIDFIISRYEFENSVECNDRGNFSEENKSNYKNEIKIESEEKNDIEINNFVDDIYKAAVVEQEKTEELLEQNYDTIVLEFYKYAAELSKSKDHIIFHPDFMLTKLPKCNRCDKIIKNEDDVLILSMVKEYLSGIIGDFLVNNDMGIFLYDIGNELNRVFLMNEILLLPHGDYSAINVNTITDGINKLLQNKELVMTKYLGVINKLYNEKEVVIDKINEITSYIAPAYDITAAEKFINKHIDKIIDFKLNNPKPIGRFYNIAEHLQLLNVEFTKLIDITK